MNPNDAADAAVGEILENASASSRCRTLRLIPLLCAAIGLLNCHGMAAAGDSWEWRNPLPQGSGLKAMAESQGRLVAVGRAGTILTTGDGMNWTPRVSGTRNFLAAVAAAGTTVVAAGRNGDIVTSTDGGLTWARRATGEVEWTSVVHGGGVWVASGVSLTSDHGRVWTSTDGVTWTGRTVPNAAESHFQSSVWTGTRFVLGGSTSANTTLLATSEDGATWTPGAPGMRAVNRLAWTGSRVVAEGGAVGATQIFVSPDGITWTDAARPDLSGVLWSGTRLMAFGGNPLRVHVSTTGEAWTPSEPYTFYPVAAAGVDNTLLVAGDNGSMAVSNDSGATWSVVNAGVVGNFNVITRFAGRWVAAGGDGILTSSADGVAWTPASSGTFSGFRALAWHDGLWVAGGTEQGTPPGTTVPRKYSLFTSTDGVTWTDRSFGIASSWVQIYSVIRAGPLWVAAADRAVLTSPDGITWQEHVLGNQNRDVAWNGEVLVVVGGAENSENDSKGEVFTSSDGGASWSIQSIGPFWRGVTWTGSQFVGVGDNGTIYTSPSGADGTWTQRPTGTGRDLRGVVADATGIVAIGGSMANGPIILTSPDGVTWTRRTAPTSQLLYSINKAGSLYVATGFDGVVLTSLNAVTWTLRDTGTTHELYAAAWDGLQLLVCGEAGAILSSGPDTRAPFYPDVNDTINAVALGPDGSTLMGGSFTWISGVPRSRLASVNPGGLLGRFSPDIDGEVHCVATQADDSVLAGGNFRTVGGVPRQHLVRLLPGGAPDESFRADTDENVRCIALQPDGAILIGGGFTAVGGAARHFIARLHANGSLDAAFNPGAGGSVVCLAVQEDGKILLGGAFTSVAGVARNYIARLHPDGSLDAGFNPDAGFVVHCLATQADGKILAGGDFTRMGTMERPRMARLDPDGSVDAAFTPAFLDGTVRALSVLTDGRILAGGAFSRVNGQPRLHLARLRPDGSLDSPAFDPDSSGSADSSVTSIGVRSDGSVMIGGVFDRIGFQSVRNFARLQYDDRATVSLQNDGSGAIRWRRGGSSPEVSQVTFDVKPQESADWTSLGSGHRTAGGWELTGLVLPPAGEIRAIGRAGGSLYESTTPILSGLERWRLTHLGMTGNTGNAADQADPDRDTIPNLIEYALGLDPASDSAGRLPNGEVIGSEFVITVIQPPNVSGITYGAEWSTALEAGSWTAIPDTSTAPQHKFRVPLTTNSRLFLRLRVTVP